jgi:hypothetical protein
MIEREFALGNEKYLAKARTIFDNTVVVGARLVDEKGLWGWINMWSVPSKEESQRAESVLQAFCAGSEDNVRCPFFGRLCEGFGVIDRLSQARMGSVTANVKSDIGTVRTQAKCLNKC